MFSLSDTSGLSGSVGFTGSGITGSVGSTGSGSSTTLFFSTFTITNLILLTVSTNTPS